jgi:hypothetical protein
MTRYDRNFVIFKTFQTPSEIDSGILRIRKFTQFRKHSRHLWVNRFNLRSGWSDPSQSEGNLPAFLGIG